MFSSGKLSKVIILSGALAILFLTHYRYLGNPFLHDDAHSIADNPHIRSLKNIPRFFTDGSMFSVDPSAREYRPALLVSYALNWAISGPRPWSWRLTNLILHALNAMLLISLLERWRRGGWATVAGVLFLLCPMSGKIFLLVSTRSALLFTTSLLLSLIAYDKAVAGDRMRWGWYAASLAACAFGLLSVAASVVIAGFIVLAEVRAGGGPGRAGALLRRRILRTAPFFALAATYLYLRYAILGASLGESYVRPMWVNAAIQLKVLYIYLKMSLIPLDYPLFYELPWHGWLEAPLILAALATLLWVAMGLRNNLQGILLLWPLLAGLPYAVVPLNVPVAEHHFYAALAGLCGWLALKFKGLGERYPRIAHIALILIIMCCTTISNHRDRVWRSAVVQAEEAVRLEPRSSRAWNELGAAYTADGRYQKALLPLRRALQIEPGNIGARYNLGISYFYMGQYGDAARELLKYKTLASPRKNTSYEDGILGMALVRMRQFQRGLAFLNRALEADPARRPLLLDKINALLELNRPIEALEICNVLLSSNPKDAEALLLRSRANFLANDLTGAKADVDVLVAMGVKAVEVVLLRVRILRKMNGQGEALEALNDALNRTPKIGPLWEQKGAVLEDMARPAEALAAYRTAITLPLDTEDKLFVRSRIQALEAGRH